MAGILSKIFGSKKKDGGEIQALLENTINELLEKANFELKYELDFSVDEDEEKQIQIDFSGPDDELLKDKDGQMIEALQLFLKRVVQHKFPDDRSNVIIDSGGYREESNQALEELAEKLKGIALEKGKSVYVRPLAPKDRKVVHQYLSTDNRVKSRSVGDGLFKKIKIYPNKNPQSVDKSDY